MERCVGPSPTYKHPHPFLHEVKLTTAQKTQVQNHFKEILCYIYADEGFQTLAVVCE